MHQEGNVFWAVDKDKYVSREIKGHNIFSVLHIKDKLCVVKFKICKEILSSFKRKFNYKNLSLSI